MHTCLHVCVTRKIKDFNWWVHELLSFSNAAKTNLHQTLDSLGGFFVVVLFCFYIKGIPGPVQATPTTNAGAWDSFVDIHLS